MKTFQLISIVIPLFNEEGNIESLYHEICNAMSLDFPDYNYEIIFINDGSRDGTRERLLKLKKPKGRGSVKLIDLLRNYGQSVALNTGFKYVSGDIVVTLDGDGQNNPYDIRKLFDKLENENLDVVVGWRRERKDPISIRIISKFAMFLRKIFLGDKIHDSGCTLRVYKKDCIEQLYLWGEMHRYISEILSIKGYKIGEVEILHRMRKYGESKYSWKKSIKGFIDLVYIWFIAKYQSRPLHLFGSIGLFTFFIGIMSFLFSIYEKIIQGLSLNRNGFFLLGIFLTQMGIMIFIFGIIIDVLIRVYYDISGEKRYIIKEVIE